MEIGEAREIREKRDAALFPEDPLKGSTRQGTRKFSRRNTLQGTYVLGVAKKAQHLPAISEGSESRPPVFGCSRKRAFATFFGMLPLREQV